MPSPARIILRQPSLDLPASERGCWAVAVSGGADSVALLQLLHQRLTAGGLDRLHVVHLDHQLRGDESDGDARFVETLSASLGVACTVDTAAAVRARYPDLPAAANASARYRRLRWALFAEVVREHRLDGVMLAHHADDQAETVLQRLLRGAGPGGTGALAGMAGVTRVHGITASRPLLAERRVALRDWLRSIDQPWREDASNASDRYQRNRLRKFLADRPGLHDGLLRAAAAAKALGAWTAANSPVLPERFGAGDLVWRAAGGDLEDGEDAMSSVAGLLPATLARQAVARWLMGQGIPAERLSPALVQRVLEMVKDAGAPATWQVPGGGVVRRTAGHVGFAATQATAMVAGI